MMQKQLIITPKNKKANYMGHKKPHQTMIHMSIRKDLANSQRSLFWYPKVPNIKLLS